ncbi:MAG: glycoside hydrolase family 127 protein [Propionibacteriaceae bacterium]|jgi:DUF1680 family protein|nr:glycoside hydrolase family 127 protein [Propionibacteriaceae bacterium]
MAVSLVDGPLAAWQVRNAEATIPHCIEQLAVSGVIDNFRRLIGGSDADFRGFVFADSDLYKTIEAVAWEIGRSGTDRFDVWLDQTIGLIAAVQEPDGYIDTWIQGVDPQKRFAELDWTHELYVMGHLIQAGVALKRCADRDDLLLLCRRTADLLVATFGPGGRDGICGHPQIEMALVELFRVTGRRTYLDLAKRFIDQRGHGLLKAGRFGAEYFQDHLPVRQSGTAVGHAVRQLYLNSGATDVAVETADIALLTAMDAQWESVHQRKMYVTGAFGAHHQDEGFGADFELPPDRAYAETCATIADLQWCWRMLLAGAGAGPGAYAAVIEREIHNALAASIDRSGKKFFYSNPLQRHPDDRAHENAPVTRQSWYDCACCPPNIARTVAQLGSYVATFTEDTLWIHLIAGCRIELPTELGGGSVTVDTTYPLAGRVRIRVNNLSASEQYLAVRLPGDAVCNVLDHKGDLLLVPNCCDDEVKPSADAYRRLPLVDGAVYLVDLDLAPRLVRAHPRVDAVRGCVAVMRGPQVMCLEQVDLPAGLTVDDVVMVGAPTPIGRNDDDRLDSASIYVRTVRSPAELYPLMGAEDDADCQSPVEANSLPVTIHPFASWGNQEAGAMRVWLPHQ